MGICTKFVLLELQEFLAALHVAGYVVIKRGTLKQFEEWWRIADNTIKRYRDMGLLEDGVRTLSSSSKSTGRLRCWFESLTLGLGIPAMIWFFSKLITSSIPAAVSGSPEQRFFFWFIAGVIAEWLFVIGVWFLLKNRGVSFRDLGVWRVGTWSLTQPPCSYMSRIAAKVSAAISRRRIISRFSFRYSRTSCPRAMA